MRIKYLTKNIEILFFLFARFIPLIYSYHYEKKLGKPIELKSIVFKKYFVQYKILFYVLVKKMSFKIISINHKQLREHLFIA